MKRRYHYHYEIVVGWFGTVYRTGRKHRAIKAFERITDRTDNGVVLYCNGKPIMEQIPDNFYNNGEE